MAPDLKDLDIQHFEPLVGSIFRIGTFEATLKKVTRGPETPRRFRTQFSLIFSCPEDFPQRWIVAPVSHPEIGSHDLLATRIVGWDEEFEVEITFN